MVISKKKKKPVVSYGITRGARTGISFIFNAGFLS